MTNEIISLYNIMDQTHIRLNKELDVLENRQADDIILINIIESLKSLLNHKHNMHFGNLKDTLVRLDKSFTNTRPGVLNKVETLIKDLDELTKQDGTGKSDLDKLLESIRSDSNERGQVISQKRKMFHEMTQSTKQSNMNKMHGGAVKKQRYYLRR